MLGKRSQMVCCRSWITAPLGEVMSAMQRGKNGSPRLRSGAKAPSASSRRFSWSMAARSLPAPS